MKTSTVLVASFVLLGLFACSSGSTGSGTSGGGGGGGLFGTGGNGGSNGGTGTGLGGIAGNGGNGTCDQACAHYLQCKGAGWDTPQNQSTCVQNCSGLGATPDQLANFVALDCPTAIQTIDGSGNTGTSGGTTSSSSGSAPDCRGCAWDGSSACIYLTGSGGNYFPCASSCCPGH
jgi:hypothetical protein